jgi:hypothetical protein
LKPQAIIEKSANMKARPTKATKMKMRKRQPGALWLGGRACRTIEEAI